MYKHPNSNFILIIIRQESQSILLVSTDRKNINYTHKLINYITNYDQPLIRHQLFMIFLSHLKLYF